MNKNFLSRILILIGMTGLLVFAIGHSTAVRNHENLFGLGTSSSQAAQFDGHQLYQETFQALRDNHIALADPAVRAKWVAEWEHKHDTDGALNTEDGADQATAEMIRSLNQRFDFYLLPEETQQEAERNDPTLVGIGASLRVEGAEKAFEAVVKTLPANATLRQKQEIARQAQKASQDLPVDATHPLVVMEAIEGGPADKAGVQKDDHIVAVDGKSIYGQPIQQIVDQIRGKDGVPVVITIERLGADGKTTQVKLSITRHQVVSHVVHTKDLGDGVAYIKLDNFESKYSTTELRDALVNARNGKAVVLDLRGNPGGNLKYVESMAAFFLKNGNVIEIHERDGDSLITTRLTLEPEFVLQSDESSDKPGAVNVQTGERPAMLLPETMPVVVLVDGNSYSAAEILSGTLQANHRAIVVGEPTGGKGVGQRVIPLPFNRTIHVTNFEFLPGGAAMDWIGVVPNIEVKQPDLGPHPDPKAPKVDAQLDAAKQAALDQVSKNDSLSQERHDLKQKHEDDFKKNSGN